MDTSPSFRQQAIDRLRTAASALRARGIVRLVLIGSVARGEDRADSDVDVLVDVAGDRPFSLIDHAELQLFFGDLLGREVDVLIRDGLSAHFLSRLRQDEISIL